MKCTRCGYDVSVEAANCTQCGEPTGVAVPTSVAPLRTVHQASDPLQVVGFVLLVLGAAGVAYFMLMFDPSIESATGGRINNNGLLVQQQNGVVASAALSIIGAIFFASRR